MGQSKEATRDAKASLPAVPARTHPWRCSPCLFLFSFLHAAEGLGLLCPRTGVLADVGEALSCAHEYLQLAKAHPPPEARSIRDHLKAILQVLHMISSCLLGSRDRERVLHAPGVVMS